jgi:hypothetical protein
MSMFWAFISNLGQNNKPIMLEVDSWLLLLLLRAPHCAFWAFRCGGHLFQLLSFLFSSLVPLTGVFPLFIYLFRNAQSWPQVFWALTPSLKLEKSLLHYTIKALTTWFSSVGNQREMA